MHIHVTKGGLESIFEIHFSNGKISSIELRNSKGKEPLSEKEHKEALKVVEANAEFITEAWINFFVKDIKPKLKKITKKI